MKPDVAACDSPQLTRNRPFSDGHRSFLKACGFVFLLFTCSGILSAQRTFVQPSFPTPQHPEKYISGRLLVRFRTGRAAVRKAAAHLALGAQVKAAFQAVPDLQLVQLPQGMEVAEAVRQYRQNPDVLYAEPDYRVFPTDVTPNDPLFSLTWGLKNNGDQNGIAGADIKAPAAWQRSTGSRSVVIGLLDTGVDYTHPELAANIYRNIPDCNSNSLDDDGNGWIDDCNGINVTPNGNWNDPIDYIGHGTHVAGTIGALGNNGAGVAGVSWQVSIIPCKFIDFDGGTTSGAIQCLDYLAWFKQHGVNIVASNNSWGNGLYSQALRDAIQAQMQLGILFIAAAGNGDAHGNSSNNDVNGAFPASYDLPNVIAVAATDRRDDLAWFSNYGKHSVHLGAPGVSVLSTYLGLSYQELSGTSMATPHVTGSAALLAAYNPALDWIGLKNLLLASGDPNPNLLQTITQKRLNIYGAMTCANQTVLARTEPRSDLVTTTANSPVTLRVLHINCASPAGGMTVAVQPGGSIVSLLDDGNAPDLAANDGVYSANWTPTQAGTYTLTFPGGDVVTVDVLKAYNFSNAASNYVVILGTSLQIEDEQSLPVALPFSIRFGGLTFDKIYAADNGIITFDRPFNTPLPLPMPWLDAGTVVAPFWDDLQPVYPGNSNVFWDVAGAAPTRQLVVEWRSVAHYPFALAGGGMVTFEAVFHEDRDEVDFNYQNVTFGTPWYADGGASAGVGIQVGPTQGTQFSYGTTSLSSGLSLAWRLADPDFALTLDSATQTVFPGQVASFTGNVKALFGLNSQVTLSCAGSPPTTCTGSTVSPTPKGANFTVSAASAVPGIYAFQVQGRSSTTPAIVHQQAATLNVVDFALSAPSPATLTIPNGGSSTSSFNLVPAGPFNASVALACAGLPAGATCSFVPASPMPLTPGTTVPVNVTVTLPAKTTLGNYAASITASTAGLLVNKTAALPISVQGKPDFVLTTANPVLVSFPASSASGTVMVDKQDGFTGPVALTCAVVPAGPTCTAVPSSISSLPGSATLTVTANSAASGSYQITANGSGGSHSHSVAIAYNVVDYTATGPSTFDAYLGATNAIPFSLNSRNGYTGTVRILCDASAFPSGVECHPSDPIDFAKVSSGNATVSISVPSGSTGGTFPLSVTLQDEAGPPGITTVINVAIRSFSFTLGAVTEQNILVGNTSDAFDLVFTPNNGYDLPTLLVPWTCNPAGAICTFTPGDTITPAGSPVHVAMKVTVPVQEDLSLGGDSSFTVFAQAQPPSGGSTIWINLDKPVTLHVQDYALVPSPPQFTLPPGSAYTVQITNQQFNGLSVPVALACPPALPPGITCRIDKPGLNPGDVASVTFSAASDVTPSLRTFNVVGTANVNGQTIQHTAALQAWVSDFSLTIDPATITVPEGGNANFRIGVNSSSLVGSFIEGIVSCTSPDAGITCDSVYQVPAGIGSLQFYVNVRTTAGATTVGPHPFNVSVTEWGQTQTITGTIIMQGTDSLVVVSPNGEELWSGGTQNIVWKYTGNPGTSVRIELLNKGQVVQTIASNVPIGTNGKGFYAWPIPPALAFSQFYTVRITSNQNPAISDTSDDRAWIGKGVDINVPNTGQVFFDGGVMFINYTWSVYGHVRFDLYKSGTFVQTIDEEPGSGYFDWPGWQWGGVWQIPLDFPPGTDYSVKMIPVDATSKAVISGNFTISKTSITVTSPAAGEVWQLGSTHSVAWTWIGQPVSPGVDVQLTLNNGAYPGVGVITPTTPLGANGSGSFTWTVPRNIAPGNTYTVSVNSFGASSTGGMSPAYFAMGNYHKFVVALNGVGFVNSSDHSIVCPGSCGGLFADGTTLTLTAEAAVGFQFTGWSGACSGIGTCVVSVTGDVSVGANFIAVTPDVALSVTPPAATVKAGQHAQYSITLTPQGNVSGVVSLTCSGLPQEAGCSFQPNNISLGQTAVTSTLVVTTTAPTAANRASRFSSAGVTARLSGLLWPISILLLPTAKKKIRRRLVTAAAIALLVSFISCGGGTSTPRPQPNPGTPSGSYTVTVTAQAGAITRTTNIALNVQ
jgi:hypothetical protein